MAESYCAHVSEDGRVHSLWEHLEGLRNLRPNLPLNSGVGNGDIWRAMGMRR